MSSLSAARKRWSESVFSVATWTAAGALIAVFAWVLTDVLDAGLARLTPTLLIEAPRQAGRAGGIAPVLVSTAMILLLCLVAVVPLGLATAVYLAEWRTRGVRAAALVRRSLDGLAAVPSIVFGLFGNALFVVYLGMGYSVMAGGLTLACMVLPLFVRGAEQALTGVPDAQRRAAAACGMTRAATLWHVLLPAAMPALVIALVLAIARAMAETAALLFTAGYADGMPGSLLDSGRSLSVHVYELAMNVAGGRPMAYATAVVLLLGLLVLNGSLWLMARRWARARGMA